MSSIFNNDNDLPFELASLPDLLSAIEEETKVEEEPQQIEKEEINEQEVILEKALSQAQEILTKAKEEADRIRKEAYEQGYIKGVEVGTEEGRQRAYTEYKEELKSSWEKVLDDIEACAHDVQHAKEKVLESHLDDLKDISLAIGEKIVQTSLKSSADVVKNMILSATGKLKKSAWAKIYIAKQDEAEEREIQGDADFLSELSRIADNVKITVMEDAPQGTCIIELPQEVMDISVNTQMENITEILNNARA